MLHFTFILGICVIATFAPLLAASTIGTGKIFFAKRYLSLSLYLYLNEMQT